MKISLVTFDDFTQPVNEGLSFEDTGIAEKMYSSSKAAPTSLNPGVL